MNEGGNATATLKAKARLMNIFKKWATDEENVDIENLISTSEEDKDARKNLELLVCKYLNSIRVVDQDEPNALLRPKVMHEI